MTGLIAAIASLNEEKMRRQQVPIMRDFLTSKNKEEKIGDVEETTDIVDRREKISWMSLVQLWNAGSNEKVTESSFL